jgi:hypothetical protein
MVQIQQIFKNQNVADICEKKNISISNQLISYLSFVSAVFIIIIIIFSRHAGIFLFSFILLVIQISFLCSPGFSFHVQLFHPFLFSVFFCSNYLDDVAQFNSKSLISSSLSSFPTTITDHVLLFFLVLLSK